MDHMKIEKKHMIWTMSYGGPYHMVHIVKHHIFVNFSDEQNKV